MDWRPMQCVDIFMLVDTIKKIVSESNCKFFENGRSIVNKCPGCGREGQAYILKENGATTCYRAKCDFKHVWFEDWLALTADISRDEARRRIHKPAGRKTDGSYSDLEDLDPSLNFRYHSQEVVLETVPWPDRFFELSFSFDAESYLNGRGVSPALAVQYDIRFDLLGDRIVFPVIMNGKCYGWQGRTIKKDAPASMKVRNNIGFKRAALVMFFDRLKGSDHAILSEGPVDAIKFHLAGGNVATMGKEVTPQQIELIVSSGVKKIYLALDEDAAEEMRELTNLLAGRVDLFYIPVPKSVKERCKISGKKADFGECTFEECLWAFQNAVPVDRYTMIGEL
jgi:hypothetical protein